MKPFLKVINTGLNNLPQLQRVSQPYFFPAWHFHPQCEIMLVLEGTGIRFVGDGIERFQPGDLIFFGRNIPHFYRSDNEYFDKRAGLLSKAIVLYFPENFIGADFWQLPDLSPLKKLFADSARGIRFREPVKGKLIERLKNFPEDQDQLSKIISLLSMLQLMTDAGEYELLSSPGFIHDGSEMECERMSNVYRYIIDRYQDNPTLKEVAGIANMTMPAFCRYFRSRTNKTYTRFLNEIKVGNACKLLIDNNLSISQICFETGFNNFTHFNRQFRRITGFTPTQYKHHHLQNSMGLTSVNQFLPGWGESSD